MFCDNRVFVAWEERIISQEKGNRVVHYYLKESSDNLILAVVGTERSIRHMIYIVSEGFVDAYGSTGIVTAGTKWRARWEVVEWLTDLVSELRLPAAFLNYQTIAFTQLLRSPGFSTAGVQKMTNPMNQIQVSRKFKFQGSDIVWSGESWSCSKQLKHYPAFCRNRTTVAVNSFVLITAEEENQYLGYLEDLYEDKKGEKMVQVRWFHHNQEVKHVIRELNAHPGEVFITPHVQEISAECINSVAAVLTPNHYEKCLAVLPENLLSGIYMCHREFKKNKIKPFSLSKLRGYYNQAILCSLDHHHDSSNKAKIHQPTEENKSLHSEDPTWQCTRRTRSRRVYQKLESGHSGVTDLIPENQREKCEPTQQKLEIKFSSKRLAAFKHVGAEPSQASLKDDDRNIELLCQDSGIRGCWFRCKILRTSRKGIKVQYYDVENVDVSGKLEEWVPASRVAAPDKLGLRFAGRLTVRPWPHNSSDCSFEVGDAVDAWWSDGWWEGVVTGLDILASDNLQVYFPGENMYLSLRRKDLRPSRDWIDNRWIEIKAKSDILNIISSTASHNLKLSTCSTSAEASKHDGPRLAESQVPVSSKLEASEDGIPKFYSPASSVDLKDVYSLNLKKRLCIRHEENLVDKDTRVVKAMLLARSSRF